LEQAKKEKSEQNKKRFQEKNDTDSELEEEIVKTQKKELKSLKSERVYIVFYFVANIIYCLFVNNGYE
jgi:hypothetical protein